MPISVDALTAVPESDIFDPISDYIDFDNAAVVTAFRDVNGKFTIESTVYVGGPSTIEYAGAMSVFGGPNDNTIKPDEGLALFEDSDAALIQDLLLPQQPPGTTGLARRLDPTKMYLACRWQYGVTPRAFLRSATMKVSNADKTKTVDARPVDWGPNINTGRTVDLSPGVATALGLSTDDKCIVSFGAPAIGHQPYGAGAGAAGDLNAIKAAISGATGTLLALTIADTGAYWVVKEVGQQDGGQILRHFAAGATRTLSGDTTVFPVTATVDIPAYVAAELNKFIEKDTGFDGPPGPRPTSDDDASSKLLAQAIAFVGTTTANAPNTEGGNLACAWAVNEVSRRGCGAAISTQGKGANGISTNGLRKALTSHTRLTSSAKAVPGAIIIAQRLGATPGHVGIVGTLAGSILSTPVYSNSSGNRRFEKNYTIGKFMHDFTAKGLDVEFFKLKLSAL